MAHGLYGRATTHRPAKTPPTRTAIVLAAGWYEGEGCAMHRPVDRCQVVIAQKDKWMVDRLEEWFGGCVSKTARDGTYRWSVYGARARGFLMTIYRFLSPRRKEQALRALGLAQAAQAA